MDQNIIWKQIQVDIENNLISNSFKSDAESLFSTIQKLLFSKRMIINLC